jgi:hypothetical protein
MAATLCMSNPRLLPYVKTALEVLAENDSVIDDDIQLLLIVKAALASQTLLYGAAVHDPSQHELDDFFRNFIWRCAVDPVSQEAK